MRQLKEFGARVERSRHRLTGLLGWKVSQAHVARVMGVSQGSYGRWENGLKEPDLGTILRLARVFGVTPEWLAFGRGTMEGDVAPTFAADWAQVTMRAATEEGLIVPPDDGSRMVVAESEASRKAREREEAAKRRRRRTG